MLEEKMMMDFKESMKAKDQLRTQTISFLRSELKYYAINNKKEKLDDADVISVLKKMVKQRQDSIAPSFKPTSTWFEWPLRWTGIPF